MRNRTTLVIIIIVLLLTLGKDQTLAAGGNSRETPVVKRIINELKRGSFGGRAGLYYEGVYHDKDNFVEDDEIVDLDDSNLVVPHFQVDYTTADYAGFSISAGVTGYSHINGDSEKEDSFEDTDDIVIHRLYLDYQISQTSLKVGRQELEDTLLLGDYYEALSLTSEEIQSLSFIFALVDKVAESDIDKFIEFENINRDDERIDDFLYAVETTWNAVPEAVTATIYYYYQGNLYDLYGAHLELSHETEEITFGLTIDAYATDEDDRNGLRDTNDNVKNSDIYHISPFIEMRDFIFAAGYIEADRNVGAREGGLIDDYFNPFNEGDKVYEPDAETFYGALSYGSDSFDVGVIFGRTEYIDGVQVLSEQEFDIQSSLKFLDNFTLETEFAIVDSDSPEGDFKILEVLLTYEF